MRVKVESIRVDLWPITQHLITVCIAVDLLVSTNCIPLAVDITHLSLPGLPKCVGGCGLTRKIPQLETFHAYPVG